VVAQVMPGGADLIHISQKLVILGLLEDQHILLKRCPLGQSRLTAEGLQGTQQAGIDQKHARQQKEPGRKKLPGPHLFQCEGSGIDQDDGGGEGGYQPCHAPEVRRVDLEYPVLG